MSLEIERKYLDPDFGEVRRRLREAGGEPLGAHFESNWIFDRTGGGFAEAGFLLRLRTQEWPDRTRHVLTLKMPSHTGGPFKVREERECAVADAASLRAIFEGLGYTGRARYEKVREDWRLPGVLVALDRVPFARVVEIEGEPEAIESAERRLHLDKCKTSVKSYHTLHQEWRGANGLPASLSFVFDGPDRGRLRQALGLICGESGEEKA